MTEPIQNNSGYTLPANAERELQEMLNDPRYLKPEYVKGSASPAVAPNHFSVQSQSTFRPSPPIPQDTPPPYSAMADSSDIAAPFGASSGSPGQNGQPPPVPHFSQRGLSAYASDSQGEGGDPGAPFSASWEGSSNGQEEQPVTVPHFSQRGLSAYASDSQGQPGDPGAPYSAFAEGQTGQPGQSDSWKPTVPLSSAQIRERLLAKLNAGPEDPEKSEEEAGHGGKGSHKSLASIEEGRTLGFRFEDPLENGELTYEQYKERFLIAKESEDRKWGAYFNFMVLGTVQHHFNMPSLVTGKGKEQVPLYSPWGSGNSILFENPITGLPESISRQFPLKDDFTRYSGELNFELLLRSPLGHTIIDFDPFYITEPKESGQLKYEVDKFGAQANIGYLPWGFSGNGDIDGFVKLKNVTKPSRFDWKGRIRHTFPDINFRVPGLAKWAEEKWDVDPFGINDNEPTFMDELAKMLFNPTFSVSVYYEHKPESDANRETLLEAAEDEWGVIVASKDTGLFVQLYEQRNTTKLYWEKVKAWRVGVALPLKSVFHILGAEALENSVADPFELDKFGFPIATTHYILRDASKVTFFVEGKKYENPQNPLIGELKRGTIGPGGRGGKDVTGESLGAGFAYSHVFKEEPFPNSPFWNKVMSNTRIQLGAQVMKLEIKGNDKPIVTQLFGQGSFGSVTVNTPASVQPKPDQDLWWSATFAMDKNWKMPGNAGYITTGFFVDYREILGEVTNNELGDDPIITVGGYVGWTPKNRFYRSVINL